MNSQSNQAQLRTKVDELVTQTLLSDSGPEATASLLAALSKIGSEAAALGFGQVLSIATELRSSMERSAEPATNQAVLDGLTRLQNALEGAPVEGGRAEAPASKPPSRTGVAEGSTTEAQRAAEPQPPSSIANDPELLSDFLVESRDHLSTIEQRVLTLEQDPENKDAMNSAFRSFHTIKGLAGFLELLVIRDAAHEVETLLDLARTSKLHITPAVVDVVLEGADFLRTETDRVERILHGKPGGASLPLEPFVRKVHAAIEGASRADHKPSVTAVEVTELDREAGWHSEPATVVPAISATGLVPGSTSAAEPANPAAMNSASSYPATGGKEPGRKEFDQPAAKELAAEGETKTPDTKRAGGSPEARFVKVETGKLDFLVDMVGELVIAQSLVQHDGGLKSVSNPKLSRNLSQLSRITGELQKTAMSMRMVPVGQLFQRSVRLVRDLARKAGKKAELEVAGEDTELDRTIVEELADPLMHMIRNSADHGIEFPEERERAGKNPTARIGLKAYHRADHIVIEVSDDGRGLDRNKLLKKARERGLVQDGANLSDKEVFNLIFEPGFSTADKVTDISGRGVGMDVVRRNIQKMRGRVDIESRPGAGTTFFLKLPLTLAIIDGLVIGVGSERYVIPIYVVREIFKPRAEAVFTLEGWREMLLVRGTLLPVVRLHRRFGVEPRSTELFESLAVVVESGEKRFCLIVDELIGNQEVVIKSLGDTFKHVSGLAGGAILGDGRVGLILDTEGLHGDVRDGGTAPGGVLAGRKLAEGRGAAHAREGLRG